MAEPSDSILAALSDLSTQITRLGNEIATLRANQAQPGSIAPADATNIKNAAQAADDAAKAIT